ncbi:alpha-2-macroglobulin-like protein 1 [Rana temporaria]|uniref:alpha-2-macroglobulin-like protein 1 n=1 Tax=Rana temporaria TaxID=8407 RepID=UPI001AAC5CFA|nr:alpha-2-macroglobulin-like protein 1 [Rana temporaria]
MQLLLVSVCLVICSPTLVSATDPHYVIFVPQTLEEGSQEKACVTIQGLEHGFHLDLELRKDDHIHEIAKQDITTAEFSHCYSFLVPSVEESSKDWSFHISGQGEDLKIDETRKIHIAKKHYSCVVQTDKSTYKPNDIVKFRLVSLDHDFHISNENYEKVLLMDPNGHHIGQWLNVATDHGFADLTYHLANDLSLGNYKFSIPNKCEKAFTVADYVLKRFEVHINLPTTVASTAKSFHLDICGSYTYGKSVQGNLDIEICPKTRIVCRSLYGCCGVMDDDDDEYDSEKCIKITHAKTDSKGCLSREIDLHAFNFSDDDQTRHLQIVATLTEDGTGHKEEASAELQLSTSRSDKKIKFEHTGLLFQRGVPFSGKIKVTDEDNQPLANVSVAIVSNEDSKKLATLETDKDGVASFTVNTDSWDDGVGLSAVFLTNEDVDADLDIGHRMFFDGMIWLQHYYSESQSFLNLESRGTDDLPCDSDLSVNVDYHINKDQLDSKTDHISFFHIVANEDGIYSHEEHKVDIIAKSSGSTLHGSFSVKVHLDAKLSPHFTLLVYTMLSKGETLSGITFFEVSACFGNKVQLKFSEQQVHPGGKVNLDVSAEAGSLCSVRSVDKGYLLQYPHENVSFADEVQRSLSRPYGYHRHNFEQEEGHCPENQTAVINWHPVFDTSFLFKVSQLSLFTNTHVKKPVECVDDSVAPRSTTKKVKKEQEVEERSPRSNFPDTWLFELVLIGPEGHTVLNLKTPDSITKWETDAVCLGKSGIGEIRNVGLVTFQDYHIDLIIPYSVVQGEKFKIDAQIFSYEKKCILVAVSLSEVDGIHTVQGKDQARCVCDGHVSHFSWDATATKLDKIKIHIESGSMEIEGDCKEDHLLITKDHKSDSIEKTIVVKPMGYEAQITETHLLYPADTTQKVSYTLNIPDRLIPGTERAHIIVVGDIMGNIIVNLENILNLPDGCGEQCVSKLSRYCYSLEYLQSTNELTPETKNTFLEHIVEGYQKQLTFKNETGGFATFPGGFANQWITALVIKALNCARQFIHVDEKDIQKAIQWLESIQLPSGCFHGSDTYFYNDIDDDEITQTAFVLIALLEHRLVHDEKIVENAKSCIKKGAENAKSSHTLALLAYAFTLLGDSEMRALMLKRLGENAKIEGGIKHWLGSDYSHGDVEISSYVILALLSDKIIDHKDLEQSAYSVHWLASKQNPWGGFYSSQDTTLALHALAKYAKAVNHKKGDSTVIIEGDSGFHREVHVTKQNSLLVQTVDLPKVPGTYTASIKGDGCVYTQAHLHYAEVPDEREVHFSVKVTTDPAVCTRDAQTKFDVHVEASYLGKRTKTNMIMIEAELLSGYVPNAKSIRKLNRRYDVRRVDVLPGEVQIYLDHLDHQSKEFVFTIEKDTHVENLHPAKVTVFDYYVPVIKSHATYNTPCSQAHCNAHAAERRDCGKPGITEEECKQNHCCYDHSVVNAKWCFFHDYNIIEAIEAHPSQETHHSHEAHPSQETHHSQEAHPSQETHHSHEAHPSQETQQTQEAH